MDADRCGIRPGSHGPSRPQYLSNTQKEKITVPDPGVSDSSVSIRVKIGDTVQKMNLDSYVQGVLRAEMPASFELEALKAQAVAAGQKRSIKWKTDL